MFTMAVGHGAEVTLEAATEGAIRQCADQLKGEPARAGIIYTSFMDVDYVPMLRAVLEAFPGIELVGCTTDGELSSHGGFSEQSVVLTLFASDSVSFVAGLGEDYSKDPFSVAKGAVLGALTRADDKPALCLTMPDGLTTIGAPLVESLRHALGDIPAYGGTAGDRFKLEQTYQFHGDTVLSDGLVFLMVCGELHFSSGVCSGWTPVGRRHKIENAEGNLVKRIGEWTAVGFYEHYLGPNHQVFPQFPLAVYQDDDDRFFLRDPLIFHDEDQSISFVGTFPEQCSVQIAEAGRDDLVAAVKTATEDALGTYPGTKPSAALVFSCCSRHIILGSRTEEEHQQVTSIVDADIPVAGFYTYGEIAPQRTGATTRYHNDTFVLLLMGEE